jgi:hypothetical protein
MPMVSSLNALNLLYVLYMHKCKIIFFICRIFCALNLLSSLFKVQVFYEALLACIKIKHSEDITSALLRSSLLKLRTNVWILEVNTNILDFSFLQWNCNETDAQFCEFVVMFLWLILVTEPSLLLRISRSNESTKVCMLQILNTRTSCT